MNPDILYDIKKYIFRAGLQHSTVDAISSQLAQNPPEHLQNLNIVFDTYVRAILNNLTQENVTDYTDSGDFDE